VVATRGGGVEEIVESGVNGVVVTPGDAGELASVIEQLIGDPDECRRLGAAGRQNAITRFSMTAMLHNMREQVEGMLQS
jgi:glycosyltransferase involved in cell wall biosynthesis